jgi:WD40 repeat protein
MSGVEYTDDDLKNDISVLVKEEISDDEDGDFEYNEVNEADRFDEVDDDDENFFTAMKSINLDKENVKFDETRREEVAKTVTRPPVVDDFIRNFLIKFGLQRSLDAFNTEWYELQAQGKLKKEDMSVVPDIYLRNQELDEQVTNLRREIERLQGIADKAKGTWDKFRKERDFHRMHHKRVVQEKERLIVDIKRLKKHYASYEPLLEQYKSKYELAMKEKMLMRLDRDRQLAKNDAILSSTVDDSTRSKPVTSPVIPPGKSKSHTAPGGGNKKGASVNSRTSKTVNSFNDTKLPSDDAVNPYATLTFEPPAVESYGLSKTFKGHTNAVSSVAFHPKKAIIATASDDETWKMWSVPNGDLIMSGDGHKDWLSSVAFSPLGTQLATGSGDCTVKVWDFASSSCALTLSEHTLAVWSVAYHHSGDFLATASMDHTAKLWDLNTGRCRQTFRDHVDSVNEVTFQPYTNTIGTCSGDKTVSLWDIRSGRCIQTFYGHMNTCSSIRFNLTGDTLATSDADGVIKVWDVRMVVERMSIITGQYPLNHIDMDRSGHLIASASDDGTVKVFDITKGDLSPIADLKGHEDAVQCVAFDPFSKCLISSGSDCTFRVWGS